MPVTVPLDMILGYRLELTGEGHDQLPDRSSIPSLPPPQERAGGGPCARRTAGEGVARRAAALLTWQDLH